MILAFSGHRFLIEDALRREVQKHGLNHRDVTRLSVEEISVEAVLPHLQSSLFGASGVILDFEGIKNPKDVIEVCGKSDAVVAIIDPAAPATRIKSYEKLGQHFALPSPTKTGDIAGWVMARSKIHKLQLDKEAALWLAEVFQSDLASIESELYKLTLIADGKVDVDLVRKTVNLTPPGDSFQMLGAATAGNTREALAQLDRLMASGEDPFKLLGAVVWQYSLVAKCVALRQENPGIHENDAAQRLGTKPFPTKKALEVARKLNENRIRLHLERILEADFAMKRGVDAVSTLERLMVQLSLH
ncbi:DNA polymerase III subunit delta [Deinococcus cellulosilyticus]|uniref:DNA-directed DNA polymerase n=1 Tax=Deinococcus cellulosilyticus (strain DSM 18568 / NBRC 106333 / KACC 11606 / 5516J-15) TaxID=1223518 RepID=A0A511N3F6_DEIC1|nr:DNA polymerase III subunit delta [Deinococcus cellulosilyticus]GEM47395.1 DNA polymerase III subunit delta [Deinococcus cellulosilyticus NBRC 106333 = KACC 11606]